MCPWLCTVPSNLKNLYRPSNQVHSHNTRFSSAGDYHVKPSRTNLMRDSIARLEPNLWKLPYELPCKRFKKVMHNMFLSFLGSEDFYIDSPTIISIQNLTSTFSQWLPNANFVSTTKVEINCPPSPSLARFSESRISSFIISMLKLHHRHCSCICFLMSTLVLYKRSIPFLLFYMLC